jgi:hypothetical protein
MTILIVITCIVVVIVEWFRFAFAWKLRRNIAANQRFIDEYKKDIERLKRAGFANNVAMQRQIEGLRSQDSKRTARRHRST